MWRKGPTHRGHSGRGQESTAWGQDRSSWAVSPQPARRCNYQEVGDK